MNKRFENGSKKNGVKHPDGLMCSRSLQKGDFPSFVARTAKRLDSLSICSTKTASQFVAQYVAASFMVAEESRLGSELRRPEEADTRPCRIRWMIAESGVHHG